MKKRIALLLILFSAFTGFVSAQTATVTIYYSGAQAWGCCNVCGTDYMCIGGSGCPCCQASQQTKTFIDPVPAGNTVTGITITYYAADCSATNVPTNLNGIPVCTAVNAGAHSCACGTCNPSTCTTTNPCGITGYVYGGVNTLFANVNPASSEICTQRVVVQITYTPGTPSGPPAPGAITGPTTFCPGQSATYSIAAVGGATSYTWTVPAGSTITSGQGTTSINVTMGSTGGQVCVTATNTCGTSTPSCINVNLGAAPATPGAITGPTTFCSGQSFTYSIAAVTGATSYTWTVPTGSTITSGQGTTSINVTMGSTAGQVCVTATGACGTSAPSCLSLSLGAAPNPPASITGTTSLCAGVSANFSCTAVAGASTYTWTVPTGTTITGGQGTTNLTVTIGSTSGNICVTATTVCGTSTPTCVPITITAIPAAPGTITGNNPVCAGSTQTYSIAAVAGATSYTWTVPTGTTITSGQGTTSINVTIGTTSGNVCVNASNTCGTSPNTCLALTVNPIPSVTNAITTQTICSGQTASFTLTGSVAGTTFTWAGSNPTGTITGYTTNGSGNISNVLTNSLTTSGTVTYTVTPTANGCTGTPVVFTVTVNNLSPVQVSITSSPAGPICDGDAVTFTATPTNGGNSPTYQWQLNGSNVGANSATYTNNALTVGSNTISISLTSSLTSCVTGNPASNTYNITVNALPNASLVASGPYCIDDPAVNLTAVTAGGTYSGNGITDPSDGTFDPATAGVGTHTITYNVTDPNTGCSNNGSGNYIVNPLPTVSFGSMNDVCLGTTAFVLTQGSPAGGTYSGNGVSNNTFSPQTAGAGTHTLTYTYTNPNTGCTSSATQNIVVNTDIVVGVNPSSLYLCPGFSGSLTASGANTYSWTPAIGLSSVSGSMVVASPLSTTTYSVFGTSTAGCTGSATVVVNLHNPNGVFFAGSPLFGCAPLTVDFNFSGAQQWTDSTWLWDFDDPSSGIFNTADSVNPPHTFMEEGDYHVQLTVTNANGCIETGSILISAYTKPEADFIIHPEVVSMENPQVSFVEQSFDANFWSWDFGDPLTGNNNNATGSSADHIFSDTGTYTITMIAESNFGCSDTVQKEYTIFPQFLIFVPNAFTPNNDGLNEIFQPVLSGIDPESYYFVVFDRWGAKVFECTNPSEGWNGKNINSDKIVKQDTYTWMLIVWDKMGNKYKKLGHITVFD